MPLEKIALYMNSSQVSGNNQLRQAIHLTFQDGSTRSFFTPYKVVGGASAVAWFLQYSVMGMVFQICDRAISTAFDIPTMPYGEQLMDDPSSKNNTDESTTSTSIKQCIKIILAPAIAGVIESGVSNRAEVQRFYGIQKFSQVENALKWNTISRICGPAFVANSSRNFIMSATSFVITPVLYRDYYPQQSKSKTSLFWFGLGVNVFIGNSIAITQQSLWGRSLDYVVGRKDGMVRNINYRAVIEGSLKNDGFSAFFTVPKWASRVMMNAPVQGTLPWFYNEILPLAEKSILNASKAIYFGFWGKARGEDCQPLMRRITKRANLYSDEKNNTTATSPSRGR